MVNDRPVSFPGPRCYTHHVAEQKAQRLKSRLRRVAKTYNLSPQMYQLLVDACPKNKKGEALCPICTKYRIRAVDHDHSCCPGKTSCGKCVRGLLCGNCNTILGRMRDDASALLRAAKYLQSPPAKRILVELQASPLDGSTLPPVVDQDQEG